MAILRRADRALLDRRDPRLVQLSTGRFVGQLTQIWSTGGVAVLPDSARFLACGLGVTDSDTVAAWRLYTINAADGAVQPTARLDEHERCGGVLVDAQRGLVYVMMEKLRIDVRRLEAMEEVVGRLEYPAERWWDARLVKDDEHLYVVLTESAPDATLVPTFRLLPP